MFLVVIFCTTVKLWISFMQSAMEMVYRRTEEEEYMPCVMLGEQWDVSPVFSTYPKEFADALV